VKRVCIKHFQFSSDNAFTFLQFLQQISVKDIQKYVFVLQMWTVQFSQTLHKEPFIGRFGELWLGH